METNVQEILTAAEAAKALRISLPTIRQYLANGVLQGRKLGKEWRIHKDALRALLCNAEPIVNRCHVNCENGICGKGSVNVSPGIWFHPARLI